MKISARMKNALAALAVSALLAWCAMDIDWSSLSRFSWGSFAGTLSRICQPAWEDFYNGSGEDIFHLMLVTIGIGFFGTTVGTVLAIPFTLLASANLWGNRVVPRVGKFVLDVLRSFPELVYAIIFIKVVGPGPFAGVLAIGVQTMFYARIPQLLPLCASLVLNHFEIAVRSASTLGLVGAGGIGATLIFAIQACRWPRVGIILLTVVVTVFLLDVLTSQIRRRLR